ncbi:hypothetical protein MTBBW1_1730008 [Desulfamplus magnetovallimortis]|uniref:Uncharacterized protein n=1 Tax=Desulfamplus magnetovallimortis TaxID=1246637 RepID=A0A1W1H9P4_9BACT|nr:hypothetical protein MTBBW1_1730008 [Desulfamplus magnetovallimortis]
MNICVNNCVLKYFRSLDGNILNKILKVNHPHVNCIKNFYAR